jgi:hypothetical protein
MEAFVQASNEADGLQTHNPVVIGDWDGWLFGAADSAIPSRAPCKNLSMALAQSAHRPLKVNSAVRQIVFPTLAVAWA